MYIREIAKKKMCFLWFLGGYILTSPMEFSHGVSFDSVIKKRKYIFPFATQSPSYSPINLHQQRNLCIFYDATGISDMPIRNEDDGKIETLVPRPILGNAAIQCLAIILFIGRSLQAAPCMYQARVCCL